MNTWEETLGTKLSTCSSSPGVPCTTHFKYFSSDSYRTIVSKLSLNVIPYLLLKIIRKVSWKTILWLITPLLTILPNAKSSLLGISASLFLSDTSLLTLTSRLHPHYKEGNPVNSLSYYAEKPNGNPSISARGKKEEQQEKAGLLPMPRLHQLPGSRQGMHLARLWQVVRWLGWSYHFCHMSKSQGPKRENEMAGPSALGGP